ncbi:hydroxycarboxylic acid receptor 2-like [Menidia menidia]
MSFQCLDMGCDTGACPAIPRKNNVLEALPEIRCSKKNRKKVTQAEASDFLDYQTLPGVATQVCPPPPTPPHPSVAPAEVARQSTQQQSRKWVPTRAGSGTCPRPGRGGPGGPGGGGCPPVGIQLEGVVLPPLLTVDVVLGLLGNLLALWLFCFRLKAWNSNSLLLFNLVLADFLALVSLPLRIDALLRGHWVFGDAVCRLNLFLMFSNRTASIALMTLVALYRYFKVVHPHHRLSRIRSCCCGERVQCFFFTAYGRGSRALRVLVGVHRALTVLEFLAAAALLLFCPARIAHALRRTRRVGRPHKARRAARVCAVIVAVFVVCFLPSTVTTLGVWLVRALRPRDCAAFYALTQLSIASLGLNFLSSALDPLVYVFSSSGFRRALLEAVPRCCRARGGQGGGRGGV